MDMRHLCFSALLLHFIFISQIFCESSLSNSRQALEIIIGIGNTSPSPPSESPNCPPPPPSPPPPCPPPSPPPKPPSPPPKPPSPPPKPPSTPPLLFFESKRIEIVYNVIQDFKKQITHDPFGITKTWVGSNICKDYRGFYCDIVPDYNVTALAAVDFNGYQFSGPSIAGFIDKLPDLAFFHANTTNFTGEIPKGIAKLRYFYELDLSNNAYSGTIPQAVFGATNLTFLDLRFNKFSGLLPPQVFFLGTDVLFVNNNNLMQKLPDNLGSTQARYITLANNKFTGSIPSSIGDASQLIEILLLNNQLSGCLPYEIGLLGNVTLFDAGQNKLSGLIPHSFACLGRIEILNLAQNELYGPVPELVCKLAHLMNLSLSYNYFTSVGPICRYLMKRNVLDVRMNCIVGVPGQRSPAECHAFFSKPKHCTSDEKTYSWIPCGKYSGKPSARAGNAAAQKSFTPLIPHKL